MIAAAASVGLVGAWDLLSSQDISLLGYVTRTFIFATVATLCARMAERARRESEVGDRYFELGNDLLCTANLEGYFVRVNDRWSEVFGWSNEELLDQPFLELIHPGDRERTLAETAQIVGPTAPRPPSPTASPSRAEAGGESSGRRPWT